MLTKKINKSELDEKSRYTTFTYAKRWETKPIPKFEIPESSSDSRVVYQIIKDELNLDGNPSLNLASFVTTWMEPEADMLMKEVANKNYVDQDEYPQTKIIHDRVVNMIANMFNAQEEAVGTATVGSSEAIMLGLLAHKWSWRKRRKALGKDYSNPNIVFGADVHSCWEKFALYFDVEMRVSPMREGHYTLTKEDVKGLIDENTIAVGAVVGTTFTGQIDDIEGINDYLIEVKEKKGWDIPIHVDAASGGFIAPFVYPDLKIDFRLERVKSINTSNHKFGLVYPGMGTLIFRSRDVIPEELIFNINYLGGTMANYSLNFSKPSSQVILQYYNFLRLGKEGYKKIMNNIMQNAHYLEDELLQLGVFEILTDTKYLPVVVLRLKDTSEYTVFDISEHLRKYGWIVPAYTLPPDAQHIAVLRIVVRENFSRDMAEMLIKDIKNTLKELKATAKCRIKKHPQGDKKQKHNPIC
ncbi:glutamate decarboxylase [Hippea jasoniae]|uniref:glutamate decarboxylase n=1 Tax=Hippea jasoniae TaxID=944479 RepID=UPI000556BF0D|nr:glutamate decarboxylase [Hippea jasoniae]